MKLWPLCILAAGILVVPVERNEGPLAQGAADNFLTGGMPYAAFDRLQHIPLDVQHGTLKVGIAPGALAVSTTELLDWISASAKAVSAFYGRFPVAAARLLIVPVDGSTVKTGQTFGHRGAAMRVLVGRNATAADLKRDWVMVHEMVHLAMAELDYRHNWLAEGLATYIESIARARVGDLTEAYIWTDFMRGMPRGLPEDGDRGFDFTSTWGRTYWGGAMFCLLADVEIRKRSNGRFGLQDAVRAVLNAGANYEVYWDIRRVFRVGDQATGLDVLMRLYDEMRAKPVRPDLESLWSELGIARNGGKVVFNEAAPLASVRRSIVGRS